LGAQQFRYQEDDEPSEQQPLCIGAPPGAAPMRDGHPNANQEEDAHGSQQLGSPAIVVTPVPVAMEVEHAQSAQHDFHFYALGMFVGEDRDFLGAAFKILRVIKEVDPDGKGHSDGNQQPRRENLEPGRDRQIEFASMHQFKTKNDRDQQRGHAESDVGVEAEAEKNSSYDCKKPRGAPRRAWAVESLLRTYKKINR